MFEWMSSPEAWVALGTLTALEIVLGIDNIVFLSILVNRLPPEQRHSARILGLVLAMLTRILLLLSIAWVSRLTMPLRMDFVHATRYSGQTEGGQLEFRVPPRLNLQDQEVLIVDDIYDVGLTLELIERYCLSRGARSVNSAVLVRKVHDRETAGVLPRFIGQDVEDKYVFGCGMDYRGTGRNLPGIYALKED